MVVALAGGAGTSPTVVGLTSEEAHQVQVEVAASGEAETAACGLRVVESAA